MQLRRILLVLGLCACPVLAWADPAPVAPLDLTVDGVSGLRGGALFEGGSAVSGTGNFGTVVRLNANDHLETDPYYGTVRGHNTTYPVHPADYYDMNGIRFDFTVGDLPVVGRDGVVYYEFLLDMNEPNNGGRYLSLEEVKIYTSKYDQAHLDLGALPMSPGDVPGETDWYQGGNPTPVDPQPVLRYDLDSAGDTAVLMNAVLSSGGGGMDIRMLVPLSLILAPGVEVDDYVYLWSLMGSSTRTDDPLDPEYPAGPQSWVEESTHEEWAVNAELSPLVSGGDWGDLPESSVGTYPQANFPTTEAGNTLGQSGAVHLVGLFEWLGPGEWIPEDPTNPNSPLYNPSWDSEEDGQPSEFASADDTTDYDDEDGVEYFVGDGDTVRVTISVSDWEDVVRYHGDEVDEFGRDGLLHLDAWWDSNGDGVFDEATEHVVTETYDPSGWAQNTHTAEIMIPGYAPSNQAPYLRWRLNYGAPNLYWGESTFGEVEDYWVTPEPASLLLLGVPLALLARRRRRRKK